MTNSSRQTLALPRALMGMLVAPIAVAAALSVPSVAGAATLGSTHVSSNSNSGAFCGGFETCGYVQTALPNATTRAPFDGRIRQWKVNLEDPGSVQLLVVRKQPGGGFKAVESSAARTTSTDGVKTFGANLPIRKGDFVGLNLLDMDVSLHTLDSMGAPLQFFTPSFQVGDIQQPFAPFFNSTEFLFNAQLKH
jgi:hypothetical protein